MKKTLLLLVVLLTQGCVKDERCGKIINKVIVEDRYFFILDAQNSLNVGSANDPGGYIRDNNASGEVSQAIYDQFNIGEEYCE